MRVSTIIVPHLEHDGQFDKSVARAVGWVLVIGASLVQEGEHYRTLSHRRPILKFLADGNTHISTKTNIATCLPWCRLGLPLSAAERCEPLYRGLTVAIAASWLSLARQQTAVDQLLAIWSEASADTAADESRWRFQYPGARTEPDKKPPAPSAAGRERVSVTAA
jgi:hypothetical protein